jgi:glutamine amidotransferase
MCRHLAYLGPPVTVRALVLDPPYGLARQAWAPRRQRHGTMNVDGFGIGWYADGDPVPARYRRAGPIWADPGLADLARVTRTRALLAAVRSATEGCESGAAAAAPYASGRWLFSHNGVLNGWPAATACLGAACPRRTCSRWRHGVTPRLAWALVAGRLRRARRRAGPGQRDRRLRPPRHHRPVQLPAHRRRGDQRDGGR